VKWQNEHWRAIQSSYASAPYFDDYGYRIREIIYNNPKDLLEFNLSILKFVMEILDLDFDINNTKSYEIECNMDYRNTDFMNRDSMKPYQQVFSYDKDFTSNLSFLDILFNEGPFMRNWILQK